MAVGNRVVGRRIFRRIGHHIREFTAEHRRKPKTALRNTTALIDGGQAFEDYAGAAIVAQEEATEDPEHTEAVTALREGREPEYDRDY